MQFETLAAALADKSAALGNAVFEGEVVCIGTIETAMVPTRVLRKPETDEKSCATASVDDDEDFG